MENENTNENKKKQKVMILIGVVTLLIAVLGATYAYFQISTNTESSNTNITGSTPAKSLVTLKPGTDNLHLNISAGDMSYENKTKEYYATDAEAKSYEENESDGTKTIASVELTGGEATTKYSCTAKLTVSKVTEPLEEADTMVEVLQPGDMILQFKGNIISEKLDLSELKTTGSKEYNLKFKVTGNTPEEIQAYIKLVNKEEQQNYLAGKKLNINISTSELKCNVAIVDTTVAQLRYEDSQGYLSEELQGGMYRYQAAPRDENEAAQMTNWICFGTTNKEECTDETDSDGNSIPDGIDKYMYRIIGITEEGQLYLLKETFLKEETQKTFVWNDKYSIDSSNSYYCENGICPEWPESLLFKRINGTSNGIQTGDGKILNKDWTDIFVDSKEYSYLKSGDGNSGGEASEWYNLIADHEWMYGDTKTQNDSVIYNGKNMYDIETGQTETIHYVGTKGNITRETYTWSNKVKAKIGLMYIHDVAYAYYDGSSEESRGDPGSNTNVKNSWIHFLKDGYNTSTDYEWLSTRSGVIAPGVLMVNARVAEDDGSMSRMIGLNGGGGVRPVFYVETSAKIADGDGTKANPYILDVQE